MTVSSTSSRVVYAGNGSTTAFPFAFRVNQPAELAVVYTDQSGVDVELSPSQYGASGFGLDAGGTVTYPLAGAPIAAGTRLTIWRNVAPTQPTALSNQGAMWPQVIEAALDRQAMVAQKLSDAVSRALVISPTDAAALDTLPAAADRAGKFLMFDNDGQPAAASGEPCDASTTSFLQAGTGAVVRDVQSRLRETVSVLDFIPVNLHAGIRDGSTTTNVHTYIQAAIDHLESLGGGTLLLPYGKYLIGAGLTVNKGVKLVGEGEIGDQTNPSIALGGTMIQWASASNLDMVTVKSSTTSHYLYGFAIEKIVLYGADLARCGVRASSIQNCDFHLTAMGFTEAGVVVDSGNGVLSLFNSFRMRYVYGVSAPTEGSHGLKFDGDPGGVGVTQNTIHWLSGLVKNGWMFWLRGSDGNHAHTVHASVGSGGVGGAVYLANGAAYDTCNNKIDVVFGKIAYESGTYGNWIGRANSEAGGIVAVTPGAGHISYNADDYVNGRQWQTHRFVMSDEHMIPAACLHTEIAYTEIASYNPASLNDGEGAQIDVTVTGVVIGDLAEASFSVETHGVILNAQVTATDTVTVRFQNETGGTIDLAGGSIRVIVRAGRAALRGEYGGLWASVKFPDGFDTVAKATVVAPYHWNDGNIVGLRLFHGMDASNSNDAVRVRVRAATKANDASVAAPEKDETFTISVNDNAFVCRASTISFASPLTFSRGDFVGVRIERVGGDGSDTAINNWHLLGVSVLYEGKGPDSPGAGTWSVPSVGT